MCKLDCRHEDLETTNVTTSLSWNAIECRGPCSHTKEEDDIVLLQIIDETIRQFSTILQDGETMLQKLHSNYEFKSSSSHHSREEEQEEKESLDVGDGSSRHHPCDHYDLTNAIDESLYEFYQSSFYYTNTEDDDPQPKQEAQDDNNAERSEELTWDMGGSVLHPYTEHEEELLSAVYDYRRYQELGALVEKFSRRKKRKRIRNRTRYRYLKKEQEKETKELCVREEEKKRRHDHKPKRRTNKHKRRTFPLLEQTHGQWLDKTNVNPSDDVTNPPEDDPSILTKLLTLAPFLWQRGK